MGGLENLYAFHFKRKHLTKQLSPMNINSNFIFKKITQLVDKYALFIYWWFRIESVYIPDHNIICSCRILIKKILSYKKIKYFSNFQESSRSTLKYRTILHTTYWKNTTITNTTLKHIVYDVHSGMSILTPGKLTDVK